MQSIHALRRRPWHLFVLLPLASLCGCVSPGARVDTDRQATVARDPAALTRIGDAAAASGDEATASTFYGRAAALAPDDTAASLGASASLVRQGQTDRAIDLLRQSIARRTARGDDTLSAALGRLLVMDRRPAEAVAVFRQALARTPDRVPLLVGLGVALEATRDVPGAQQSYGRALVLDPGNVAARNDLCLSQALAGRATEAEKTLRTLRARLLQQGGSDTVLATIDGNLALVSAMQGRMDEAARYGAGAAPDPGDLAANMRFYRALAPGYSGVAASGDEESSGLAGAAAGAGALPDPAPTVDGVDGRPAAGACPTPSSACTAGTTTAPSVGNGGAG